MNNKTLFLVGGALILLLLFYLIKIPVTICKVNNETFIIKNKNFQIEWIHSVEKEKWIEKYKRENNKLVLTNTILKAFGAGTPYNAKVINNNNESIELEINRKLDNINLIISKEIKTTIIIDKKEISLYKIFEPYTEMEIYVEKLNLINYYRKESLYEKFSGERYRKCR